MRRTVSRKMGAGALVVGVAMGVYVGGTVGAIVGVLLAMIGFQALTRGVEGRPYIVTGLLTTAGLALIAWAHGLDAPEVGLGRSTWVHGIAIAIGIVLVVGIVIGVAGSIPRLQHLFADERITEVSGLETTRKALLDIPIGTVLIEEFAFRGVLLALGDVLWPLPWAVVWTSVLFGLWHISPALEMHDSHQATQGSSWTTVVGTVIFTGLSGVGFAVLRLWTGSLFPPAALHWAANGTGVVVGWFVHRRLRRRTEYDPVGEPEDPGHTP